MIGWFQNTSPTELVVLVVIVVSLAKVLVFIALVTKMKEHSSKSFCMCLLLKSPGISVTGDPYYDK